MHTLLKSLVTCTLVGVLATACGQSPASTPKPPADTAAIPVIEMHDTASTQDVPAPPSAPLQDQQLIAAAKKRAPAVGALSTTNCTPAYTMAIYGGTDPNQHTYTYDLTNQYNCPAGTRIIGATAVLLREGMESVAILPLAAHWVSSTNVALSVMWPEALMTPGNPADICVRFNYRAQQVFADGSSRVTDNVEKRCNFTVGLVKRASVPIQAQQVIQFGATDTLLPAQFKELKDRMATVRTVTALTGVFANYYVFSQDSAVIKACMTAVDFAFTAYWVNAAWRMAPIMAKLEDPALQSHYANLRIYTSFVKFGGLYAPYWFQLKVLNPTDTTFYSELVQRFFLDSIV